MTTHSLINKKNTNKAITNKQKIVIVGQGAMGLLYYHHLQKAKNQVSILSPTSNTKQLPHAPELSTEEYLYTGYQSTVKNVYPLSYSQVVDLRQADIILLAVKSYQIAQAVKTIAHVINKNCLVVLAHNGMGTITEIVKLVPAEQRILSMLTTHGCLKNSPLDIIHTGRGHSDIGLLTGKMTNTEIETLTLTLNNAMPSFSFSQNIIEKQWLKLAINCVINPITALQDIDNGYINREEFSQITTQLITEIVSIAQFEGIFFSIEQLTETVRAVAKATSKNSSSMRCDVLAKRHTEIDYINGYIHHLGEKHDVATPINTQVWQAVKKLEIKI